MVERIVAGVLCAVLLAAPAVAGAQSNVPYKRSFYLFIENSSDCSGRIQMREPIDIGPQSDRAVRRGQSEFSEPIPVQVGGRLRATVPARQHSIVTIARSCEVYVNGFDASTAEARYERELRSINERNDAWRARGTRQVVLGTLVSVAGLAGLASGSDVGIGVGAAGIGVGIGMFLNARSHYQMAEPSVYESNRIGQLEMYLRILREP
jgi:hypothetical protein